MMAETMNKYETIFVIDSTKTEEEITALVEKFKSLIEKYGEIESIDEWGKRRLAYPINDLTEGYYVLVNFTAKPDFPTELERVYGITDGIIRDIVVRREEA
jgi:small subunit ribosomal protein S6